MDQKPVFTGHKKQFPPNKASDEATQKSITLQLPFGTTLPLPERKAFPNPGGFPKIKFSEFLLTLSWVHVEFSIALT